MGKKVYLLDLSNNVRQAAELVLKHRKDIELTLFSDAASCHAAMKHERPETLVVDADLASQLPWISMGELVSIPLVKLSKEPGEGAADVAKKPFNSQGLVDAIQQAFDRGEAQAPASLQDLMEVTQEAKGPEPEAFFGSQHPGGTQALSNMSPATVEALARKTIEEVVWEVVPKLAESMLKEAVEKEMAKRNKDEPLLG